MIVNQDNYYPVLRMQANIYFYIWYSRKLIALVLVKSAAKIYRFLQVIMDKPNA